MLSVVLSKWPQGYKQRIVILPWGTLVAVKYSRVSNNRVGWNNRRGWKIQENVIIGGGGGGV